MVVQVALPTIQREVGGSFTDLQWVIDAYMVVLASLLLVSGATADRVGRRAMFSVGLLTFAGRADVQCPLTRDYGLFLKRLEDATPDAVARRGTSIGDAVRQARRAGIAVPLLEAFYHLVAAIDRARAGGR